MSGLTAGKWTIEGEWLSCPLGYDGNSQSTYDIHLSRVRTPSHVVVWIAHLSEKTWATRPVLHDFTLTTMKHLGIELGLP